MRITKQKPINKNTVTKRLSISETPNKIFTAEIMSGTGSPNHPGDTQGSEGTHGRRQARLTLGD